MPASYSLPILAGNQPAEVNRKGATLSLPRVQRSPDICSTQRSPVNRVGTYGISNRDTRLYQPHNSSVHLTTTTEVRGSERINDGISGWTTSKRGVAGETRRDSVVSHRDIGIHPSGMALPRSAWVRLGFRYCRHKWGMIPSAACECGAEQSVDHVILQYPIHRPSPRSAWPDGSG